jgi:hypothetical protein
MRHTRREQYTLISAAHIAYFRSNGISCPLSNRNIHMDLLTIRGITLHNHAVITKYRANETPKDVVEVY